eukprot:352178-Chlamydomonas_euryale.AAC.9
MNPELGIATSFMLVGTSNVYFMEGVDARKFHQFDHLLNMGLKFKSDKSNSCNILEFQLPKSFMWSIQSSLERVHVHRKRMHSCTKRIHSRLYLVHVVWTSRALTRDARSGLLPERQRAHALLVTAHKIARVLHASAIEDGFEGPRPKPAVTGRLSHTSQRGQQRLRRAPRLCQQRRAALDTAFVQADPVRRGRIFASGPHLSTADLGCPDGPRRPTLDGKLSGPGMR